MADPRQLRDLLLSHADDPGVALAFEEETWTWPEYVAECAARAHLLAELLPADRPRHVGVLLENTPEMAMLLGAGALGGHVTVGINATRRGEPLAADIRRADCALVLTDAALLPLLDGLDLGGVEIVDTDSATDGDSWRRRVAEADRRTDGFARVASGDIFMLIFTSGTSGDPKAVKVAHGMVLASAQLLAGRFGLGPDDVCYCAMPLFHSNAIAACFGPALAAGSTLALARRFTASGFLADVRHFGATYANYVGKPLAYVLATPERPDDSDNPLRFLFGNEASDRDIAEFGRRFGCRVWDGFGSTENAVIITRVPETPAGSIGMPRDGVAVYDRDTGAECQRAVIDAAGRVTNLDEAVGELVNTEGAGFFSGYYGDEAATEERLRDGVYWSGDLAYRDQAGYVYLAGRTSDWLRVDGENLAAAPIERLLLRHPDISLAAVYGVPADDVGDDLMAALVLRAGAGLEPAGLSAFLCEQADLSPKAWPRHVRIATELPCTATNKVLKRQLQAQGTTTSDPVWSRGARDRVYVARGGAFPIDRA